jgi:hypothetical protein
MFGYLKASQKPSVMPILCAKMSSLFEISSCLKIVFRMMVKYMLLHSKL